MCRHRKGQICDALGPRGIANGEVAAFGCDLHLLLPKLGFMFPCQRTERFAKRHELTVLLRLLTVESAGTTAVADPSDALKSKSPFLCISQNLQLAYACEKTRSSGLREAVLTPADIPDAPRVQGFVSCNNQREAEHFLPLVRGEHRRNQVKQQATFRCGTIVALQVTRTNC